MEKLSTLSLLRDREYNNYYDHKRGYETTGYSWDLVKSLHRLPSDCPHGGCVNSVKFSKNGNYMISGSDDKCVKLWDMYRNPFDDETSSSLLLGTVKTHHTQNIFCADLCPHNENLIASCAADGTLRLNDFSTLNSSTSIDPDIFNTSSRPRQSGVSNANTDRLLSKEVILAKTKGIM